MRRLLRLCVTPAFLLYSCTRTVETRSESAFQAAQQKEETKAETVNEVVRTGPSTTTVYKFALPDHGADAKGVPSVSLGTAEGPNGSEELLHGGLHGSAIDAHPFGQGFSPPRQHEAPRSNPDQHADNLPLHGALVEMDVIQTGPILDTKRQTDKEASTATLVVKADSTATATTKTSYWPPFWLWLALAALLAGVVAAVRLGLKMPFGL